MIKTCASCIHFKPIVYGHVLSNRCLIFYYKDKLTNLARYDFASVIRNDSTKCGLAGKYYVENKFVQLFKVPV